MAAVDGYLEFLEAKKVSSPSYGFDPGEDVSDVLFGFQRDIVRWAVAGGRRAIFAAFGLGKSLMQLECMRLVGNREGGRQLIICPLGVRQEFKRDAKLLDMQPAFVRRSEEVAGDGLYLTNYESVRDGRLDVNLFNGVSLDEASVLRSYGSKTYQTFLELFQAIPYRFVATATPSPNRYKELIHYAGYLGVMDTGQALTRFFKRDSTKANNLTLYPHKEREFWLWLASWAVFVQKPSDLGYSDEGYDLPPLDVRWHELPVDECATIIERNGQESIIADVSMSLSQAAREKRASMAARVAKAKELIDEYFATYPKVKDYMEKSIEMARQKGYTETLFGRRCYLPDINSHNATVRGFAERNAINAPIQGTAADIIKIAMVRIDHRMQAEGIRSKMILQVHDELNFSVLPEEKEALQRLVIEEMERAFTMSVPLIADCGWGKNWLEAH